MAGIVVAGTVEDIVAAGVAAMDMEIVGIVAGKAIECTAAARTGWMSCRREDTGSDNNPSRSRACASIPPLGCLSASVSSWEPTDPVAASSREPPVIGY